MTEFELVIVATDQQDDLDAYARAVHAALQNSSAEFPAWNLTVLDNGSSDATFAVAERLAAELDRVRCVRLPERADRKALRKQFRGSNANTVAFLSPRPDTDFDALLAPLTAHGAPTLMRLNRRLNRRAALAVLGGVGITALVAACGGSKPKAASAGTSSTEASSSSASTSTAATTALALAPEMTEGPYFLDLNLVRSDITEDREGAPLALTLRVIDVGSGTAIKGAKVDIWHCDANGLYSGFVSQSAGANSGSSSADDGTFLRGTQVSDADGAVTFATIYPGWYRGRTVHIHLKVHAGGTVVHTGQLFFDDASTDTLYAGTAPYSSRATRDTLNANDSIYGGGGSQSTLAVQRSGDHYAAALDTGVHVS